MPTGFAKEGVRRTWNWYIRQGLTPPPHIKPRGQKVYTHKAPVHLNNNVQKAPEETDEQIEEKLRLRFGILHKLTNSVIKGDSRALIVSGAPGLGKSHLIETALHKNDPTETTFTAIKGFVRATGLFKTLYQYRFPGRVVVFDDCDAIFNDDVALNILKAVCDTGEKRFVSWMTEAVMFDDDGFRIPKQFEFEGAIIFITNIDFDEKVRTSAKLGPHCQALQDRAHYVDLAMRRTRDRLIRVKQVVKEGLLKQRGLNKDEEKDVLTFIEQHLDRLREPGLSLRTTLKVADLRKTGDGWYQDALTTILKQD